MKYLIRSILAVMFFAAIIVNSQGHESSNIAYATNIIEKVSENKVVKSVDSDSKNTKTSSFDALIALLLIFFYLVLISHKMLDNEK